MPYIEPLSIQAGGEALEPRTRQVLKDAFGIGCGNFYGATEAGVIAASLSDERLVVAEDKVLLETQMTVPGPSPDGAWMMSTAAATTPFATPTA